MSKILWVDDEPFILSAAKRLLVQHGFEVITTENPSDVIRLMEENQIDVLVTDQRMPQMTGVELLRLAKEKFPFVTRMMVTGFYDKDLLEEAINVSGVFRFITKPWSEHELIADLKQAQEHSIQIQQNKNLSKEVRQQNKVLTQLTENLENIIFERTKEINIFNKEQENKNKHIGELVHFIQDIQHRDDLTDLFQFFLKEIRSKFPIETLVFCYRDSNCELKVLFSQKKEWHTQKLQQSWLAKNEIRSSDKVDQQFLVDNIKRPFHKIIAFPLLKFKNSDDLANTIFVEHSMNDDQIRSFMDSMISRLQILSLATDRILYLQKIDYDSKQWEYTFDSIANPICIIDVDGQKIKSNAVFKKSIKNLEKTELGMLDKLSTQKHIQNEIVKRDSYYYDVIAFPIREPLQDTISYGVIYYRNITDDRHIYEKMIQNEKMAALGLMAGNIGHELNNPLTGIRSLAQILKTDKEIKKEFANDFEEIDKAAQRCQVIIQGLKDFSKLSSQQIELQKILTNEIVQKTLLFLKSAVRNHQLQLHLAKTDFKIHADPRILQQVLFNIVINACQALEKPGIIQIRTQKRGVSGIIEIEDNGSGIPSEIQGKIFEPFFTTKKDGEGTGLGLSFCKDMMGKMGGQISFESSKGKGTVFKLKMAAT